MELFNLLKLNLENFSNVTREYMNKLLGTSYNALTSSKIYGQILNVINGAIQNVMLYLEDALNEQNKYTAQRKKSIYSLAQLSGYNPSLGSAAKGYITLQYKSNNIKDNILLPNKTKIQSISNGLVYNIVLPSNSITLNALRDNSTSSLSIVEGTFETRSFTVEGGDLYSINVFSLFDIDLDYIEVKVNSEIWTREESLYDMEYNSKTYFIRTSLDNGIDIVFGNTENGKKLEEFDVVTVTYLTHHGENGNILPTEDQTFIFKDNLTNTIGEEVDANELYILSIDNNQGLNTGSFGESTNKVRDMIGYNSRSLVLADAKNYNVWLSRFSFVGYNRTWVEKGSMVVNSLIMRNFKALLNKDRSYFSLSPSDFLLTQNQKDSIYRALEEDGRMLAGMMYNIIDIDLKKYALFIYIKPKTNTYSKTLKDDIKAEIGNFFANEINDQYIPKSDIISMLKNKFQDIDGIEVYFLSQANEQALIDSFYDEKIYKYNILTQTYDYHTERVILNKGENPNLGLDQFGNILLQNDMEFPLLAAGWQYKDEDTQSLITVLEPVNIIIQSV